MLFKLIIIFVMATDNMEQCVSPISVVSCQQRKIVDSIVSEP